MNDALVTLCRDVDGWHPTKRILSRGKIPVVGWMRCVHESDPGQTRFLRLGLLVKGILIQPLTGISISRTRRHLGNALEISGRNIWLYPKKKERFAKHAWDVFTLDWQFICVSDELLQTLPSGLTIFTTLFHDNTGEVTTNLISLMNA